MFQPMIVGTGLVAWRNLQRSLPEQKALHAASPEQSRIVSHFRVNATGARSATAIVGDRQLRQVALTAFGLQDDLNNTYFVKRVLEEGTASPASLANKMSDSRYRRMADEFAFDGATQFLGLTPERVATIVAAYRDTAFELSLADAAPNLRLALNAERDVARIGALSVSEDAKWFSVMGSPPLRQVLENALGLPSSFGTLDIDQQLGVFKKQAQRAFGTASVTDLSNSETLSKLIDRFLLKEQLQQNSSLSSMNIALQLIRV